MKFSQMPYQRPDIAQAGREVQACIDALQKAALTRGSLKANAWAAQYIKACIEAGAMTDVGGGTIERPQDFATREELAKVAAVMAQR